MYTCYSIYLHIPFCKHRCSYCDFNTFSGLDSIIPEYVRALCGEIKSSRLVSDHSLPIQSIYFGGGTPSLLTIQQIETIINYLNSTFEWRKPIEITIEANPGTLSQDYLKAIYSLGINRLSIGAQSSDPSELHLLDRQHNFIDVVNVVNWAQNVGFSNINLDLIYGLPNQKLGTWERTLEDSIELSPEHISIYSLSVEEGTPLSNLIREGVYNSADSDLAADMYELASEKFENEGFHQYEISNWARKSTSGQLSSCVHNLQYWRNLPYLGFGAGAHGYANGKRTVNILSPINYVQSFYQANHPEGFPQTFATQSIQTISREDEISETMMMGLRLVDEGISELSFLNRFGQNLALRYKSQIPRLLKSGLIEWKRSNQDRCLRLTKKGRLLGNQVFIDFI